MSEGLTPQQILQLLASMLGGGLTGSALTTFLNWRNARCTATAKENGAIAALASEVRRSSLLCQHNAQLITLTIAPFIHFPTKSTLNVTFEERHSYTRLGGLQPELECYTLAIIHVNELIDVYRLLVVRSSESSSAQSNRDELRQNIASICAGDARVEGVAPESSLVLPAFIDSLSQQIEHIRRSHP